MSKPIQREVESLMAGGSLRTRNRSPRWHAIREGLRAKGWDLFFVGQRPGNVSLWCALPGSAC